MTSDDFYTVDGSKVWLSPTALQYAQEYFGPGRAGVQKMAEYLRLRHTMQQAALTSPTAAMSVGEEQAPLPQQDDLLPSVLGVTPDEAVLPTVRPFD